MLCISCRYMLSFGIINDDVDDDDDDDDDDD